VRVSAHAYSMSHQTGIVASQELKEFFARAKGTEGDVRLIKCGICTESEEIVLQDHRTVVGTWDEDYNDAVLAVLKENEPCYLFYRLDSKNNLGYEWLLINYTPDSSEVRKKMVAAGTRSTIKLEFGGGYLADELSGTNFNDVNLEGYHSHVKGKSVAAPLTIAEEELNEVKMQHIDAASSGKSNTLPGISFPISDEAITELIRITNKEITYVQLSVDVDKEAINLEEAGDVEVADLQAKIPKDAPRYHFFVFKHTFEGDYLESIVFIYSMPGYSASVKERMLYSSCKATLLSGLQEVLKMEITKKLEMNSIEDVIDENTLMDDVHPKKDIVRQKFAKPKGPGGRGQRRMIKKTEDADNNNTE